MLRMCYRLYIKYDYYYYYHYYYHYCYCYYNYYYYYYYYCYYYCYYYYCYPKSCPRNELRSSSSARRPLGEALGMLGMHSNPKEAV